MSIKKPMFFSAHLQKNILAGLVVLINFPSSEMKTVGFVTQVVRDVDTGEELAAVYMPTAPNPTSGYMEIVPMAKVMPTDWTIEEGMQFVISCGTSIRDPLRYRTDSTPECKP